MILGPAVQKAARCAPAFEQQATASDTDRPGRTEQDQQRGEGDALEADPKNSAQNRHLKAAQLAHNLNPFGLSECN
jgi:hypothetical protein